MAYTITEDRGITNIRAVVSNDDEMRELIEKLQERLNAKPDISDTAAAATGELTPQD